MMLKWDEEMDRREISTPQTGDLSKSFLLHLHLWVKENESLRFNEACQKQYRCVGFIVVYSKRTPTMRCDAQLKRGMSLRRIFFHFYYF